MIKPKKVVIDYNGKRYTLRLDNDTLCELMQKIYVYASINFPNLNEIESVERSLKFHQEFQSMKIYNLGEEPEVNILNQA